MGPRSCHSPEVVDDDDAVRAKLAALEAEVKADAEAQRARKEAALAKAREARSKQLAENQELRQRQAQLVSKSKAKTKTAEPEPQEEDAEESSGELGGALELASRANKVKQELARKPKKGDKSWVTSGLASTLLGPLGWMYAGSLREAIPASILWIAAAAILTKLPALLLWPLLFLFPLSGIAGVVYALQYNRHGGRQRIFDKGDKNAKPKQLRG